MSCGGGGGGGGGGGKGGGGCVRHPADYLKTSNKGSYVGVAWPEINNVQDLRRTKNKPFRNKKGICCSDVLLSSFAL